MLLETSWSARQGLASVHHEKAWFSFRFNTSPNYQKTMVQTPSLPLPRIVCFLIARTTLILERQPVFGKDVIHDSIETAVANGESAVNPTCRKHTTGNAMTYPRSNRFVLGPSVNESKKIADILALLPEYRSESTFLSFLRPTRGLPIPSKQRQFLMLCRNAVHQTSSFRMKCCCCSHTGRNRS